MAKKSAPTAQGERVNRAIIALGKNPSQDQVTQAILSVIGPIDAGQVPAGSTITYQDPTRIEYIDNQGAKHTLTRTGDANDPNFGRIIDEIKGFDPTFAEQSLRQLGPSFMTEDERRILSGLQDRISNPSLQNFSPEDQAFLDQINAAENAALEQQFEDAQGKLVSSLFGRGVEASSIAGTEAARLAQEQGLVRATSLANQGQRALGLKEFLSNLNLSQTGLGLEGLRTQLGTRSDALDRLLQGEISGRQLGLQAKGLGLEELKLLEDIRSGRRLLDIQQQQVDKTPGLFSRLLTAGVAGATSPGFSKGISDLFGLGGARTPPFVGAPT